MGQWQSQPVCTTPACVHASSLVLRNLNPDWQKLDPCVDFDKMVCYGNREHEGDDGGTTGDVNNRNMRIMRRILESKSYAEAADIESTYLTARDGYNEYNFDMLRTAYATCMDEDANVAAGSQPLTDLWVSVNKTWPVSPTDLETPVGKDYGGLIKASIMLEEYGVDLFHSDCGDMPVMPDFINSKVARVCFNNPKLLSTNTSIYGDETALEKHAARIATWFGETYPGLDEDGALALANSVAIFEIGLVGVMVKAGEEAGQQEYPVNMTLAQLDKTAPVLGFGKLIAALTPAGKTPDGILAFTPGLWPLLSDFISQQPKAAVQAWIMRKAMGKFVTYIDAPKLYEQTGNRWSRCLISTRNTLTHILESYFVAATYPDQTLQAADRMTTGLRTQFKKRLSQLDWMSSESKARAAKKADNIQQNIGYPRADPDLRSAESVAAYYDGVNVTSSSHFDNILSGLRNNRYKAYADAATGKSPRRTTFLGPISQVNAFYFGLLNIISIPAGITQLPLFHYHLPDYALYGGLGSIIGHEITHGFDSKGRQFNEDGETRVWWDNATINNFQDRAQCFADQFSKFEVDIPDGKANVDGEKTLGENISDAGGLRMAYEAWLESRKAMPNAWDQGLPGLEAFSHEQLFFLFWGNTWCENQTPAAALNQLQTDNHSPHSIRILGGVQNSRAFKEVFKCKAKEPKCELF
ncbi:hypothetical protein N0V88_007028 [Collariella sp. IMI 366227]|nr:hypothetical protein N0V88_007028 [Collariella sp. IMI 366227]